MGALIEKEPGLGRTPEIKETRFQFSFALDDPEIPINKVILGGKGAGLVEMTRLDLPVPPGFILTTEAWRVFDREGRLPDEVWRETLRQLADLEFVTGLEFGDSSRPLSVSIRSGAPHSMPGLLSTILNVGLNDKTVWGLAQKVGEWCAWDSYRLGIESFATGVAGKSRKDLNSVLASLREKYRVLRNQDLPLDGLKEATETYKTLIDYPQNPYQQLHRALEGVFRSWDHPDARAYREATNIPHDEGTAITIQEMVFGNKPDQFSGSGVCFTRDPQNGKAKPKVAYLLGAQGKEVVGPESTHQLTHAKNLPEAFSHKLIGISKKLENEYGYPQEIEFVYDGNKLWLLQTRNARLSPEAALYTLYDWARQQKITQTETIEYFTRELLDILSYSKLNSREVRKAKQNGNFLGRGIPISSGIAIGRAVDNVDEAKIFASFDVPLVLVLDKLTKYDLVNLPLNTKGVITRLGGAGSHIAQILRGAGGVLNIPAIFGFEIEKIKPGTEITLDATTGEVFIGRLSLALKISLPPKLSTFLKECQGSLRDNPWFAASYPLEGKYHWETLTQEAKNIIEKLKWQSPKAQTIDIIAKLIPAEERIGYLVLSQGETEEIRSALKKSLDEMHDASVRSCHNPPKLGQAPWQRITRLGEIEPFLDNRDFPSKYGGYPKWQEDKTFTEAVIGRMPRGKLDPELSLQHCIFTVSCMEKQVIVQIIPHTAQMRDLEQADPKKIITVTAMIDPRSPTRLGQVITQPGQDIEDDPESQRFTDLVSQTVFERWWVPPFALPHRLAALTQVAKLTILEGQARIYPEGNSWCLVYGMKGKEEPEDSI